MPKQIKNTFFILLIIIFAALIRSINIGKFGIYGDEKYSIMVVNGISWEGATQKEVFAKKYFTPKEFWEALTFKDFNEAIIRTDNGNSSTYYGLLYVWKSIFGMSDGALRWMGVLFDCFTILLVFLFCTKILERPIVGLIAGFLLAIEPFLIAYSHQIRNYPVGIFLTFLSTYLFFRILKNESEDKQSIKYFIGYGATVLFAILSHYYVVLFIFCQFIVLIISRFRQYDLIKRFIITYCCAFFVLGLWFTIGAGKETFETLKSKDEIFANIVKNPPNPNTFAGWVEAPTFANIKNKLGPIITDNLLITNDLYWKFNGKVNFLVCLFLSLILFAFLLNSSNNLSGKGVWISLLVLIGILAVFYSIFTLNPLYYLYLSFVFLLFINLIFQNFTAFNTPKKEFLLFATITFLFPILITVLGAIKGGHTANIYQKYLSFALPVIAIVTALGFSELAKYKSIIAYFCLLAFLIFGYTIYKTDKLVLNDTLAKYTIFDNARASNPHLFVANQISKLYSPGDTVIYPSYTKHLFAGYDPQMDANKVSVVDAQLTNVYLDKNAEFIQRVEPNEPDKLYLYQQKSKKKLLIFDFEGQKYRY